MNQITIPGSHRQKTTSRSGDALERGYIYMTPTAWRTLYALAKASGVSASLYLESLLPTVSGKFTVKETNVSTTYSRSINAST